MIWEPKNISFKKETSLTIIPNLYSFYVQRFSDALHSKTTEREAGNILRERHK
jgi:hypothetical protein